MFHFSTYYKHWRYKNTTLLVISLVLLFFLVHNDSIHATLSRVSTFGYFGVFVVGMFFVSTFTVAPSLVVLTFFAEALNPLSVATVAGMGAVVGDYVIFRFLKEKVFEELRPLFFHSESGKIGRLFSTPYFAWLAPVLGALIIASPFPDEFGVALLGGTQLKKWQFIALTFPLNTVGIFITIMAARAL